MHGTQNIKFQHCLYTNTSPHPNQIQINPVPHTLFLQDLRQTKLTKEKRKGKVHSITGNEGPEDEYRHSSSLSLTSATGVVSQGHAPANLLPEKTHGIQGSGGWVGIGAGLDR
jgi:hypothetical protein